MAVTQEAIGEVMTGILSSVEAEFKAMSKDDLKKRWYFEHDPARSLAWTIYDFNKMLDLYSRSCRRWEEMHNGHSCVVERVRDEYLMPKIKEFEEILRERILAAAS